MRVGSTLSQQILQLGAEIYQSGVVMGWGRRALKVANLLKKVKVMPIPEIARGLQTEECWTRSSLTYFSCLLLNKDCHGMHDSSTLLVPRKLFPG